MNRLLKNILKFTIVPVGLLGGVVFASEPTVVGSVLALTDTGFQIIGETTFDTLEECWASASEFNAEAAGKGFVAVCWPFHDPALGV
jgi:hypothetical protein